MLDELSVTNLGIIASARVEFTPGMVVVSGETGAGKTLLLGALRLLTGAPASPALIGPHGDQARVEGRFFLDGDEVVLSRLIHRRGSRAYMGGAMVPARVLAERLDGSVEIVGQHDPLALTRPGKLRALIDLRLDPPDDRDTYRSAWRTLKGLEAAGADLGGDLRSLERELDLLSYQINEIDRSGFHVGEDEDLHIESGRLAYAEEIRDLLGEARRELVSARDRVGPAVAALRRVCEMDPSQAGLGEMLEGISFTIEEAITAAREVREEIDTDPERLTSVNERLSLLGDLRRKYGAGIEEILQYRESARKRLAEVEGLVERAATIDADLVAARRAVENAGRALREARSQAASRIAEEAAAHLRELGFGSPTVRMEIGPATPGPSGADTLQLLFSSDARLEPGPVSKVASGGELSRLVLSLRLASGVGAAGVVVFDEIDAGVGGTTALAMGAKLAGLAEHRQALCVSHLPQVAAFADTHIVVERDGPAASVRTLDEDQRLRELSRMLSGLIDSEQGYRHAVELRSVALARRTPG